jgi:hypothetical protein
MSLFLGPRLPSRRHEDAGYQDDEARKSLFIHTLPHRTILPISP